MRKVEDSKPTYVFVCARIHTCEPQQDELPVGISEESQWYRATIHISWDSKQMIFSDYLLPHKKKKLVFPIRLHLKLHAKGMAEHIWTSSQQPYDKHLVDLTEPLLCQCQPSKPPLLCSIVAPVCNYPPQPFASYNEMIRRSRLGDVLGLAPPAAGVSSRIIILRSILYGVFNWARSQKEWKW